MIQVGMACTAVLKLSNVAGCRCCSVDTLIMPAVCCRVLLYAVRGMAIGGVWQGWFQDQPQAEQGGATAPGRTASSQGEHDDVQSL
jgi:hypothetical protein